ncbi:MAG: helix-turn-helix transcriptional regulator [Clostridia bacterium]|nr:helix-turn-helix transcriptional regulator [Clostridia bacterium]
MNLFVVRLKELLVNKGKLQKDVCVELGISKQKLSKWKTGYNEPSLDELIMIASYFDVSVDYLLGLEDDSGTKTDIVKISKEKDE